MYNRSPPFPQNYKNQRLNKYSFFTSYLKNALLHTSHKSKDINHRQLKQKQ